MERRKKGSGVVGWSGLNERTTGVKNYSTVGSKRSRVCEKDKGEGL